jgi:hypothetical protein
MALEPRRIIMEIGRGAHGARDLAEANACALYAAMLDGAERRSFFRAARVPASCRTCCRCLRSSSSGPACPRPERAA